LDEILLSADKKRVMLKPKYLENLMKLYKLDKIYKFVEIGKGKIACDKIYHEIRLISSNKLDLLIKDTKTKFDNNG
jgi:septum formation topological specificity factor MinE